MIFWNRYRTDDVIDVGLTGRELQILWDFLLSHGFELNEEIDKWKPINRKISGALCNFARGMGYEEYRKLREVNNF